MEKTISHEFFFPHPPEVVWDYLTRAELLEQWIMRNDFQPVVGHDFKFTTKPIPALDFDGNFYCKVLEVVPLKKISYEWKSGSGDGKIALDSIVVWKLEKRENGTNLLLEHSGFSKMEHMPMFNGLNDGWLKNIQKVANQINSLKHDATNS